MRDSFAPIFGKLVDSSVWEEPYGVRVLWVTMLVMRDKNHMVPIDLYLLRKKAGMESEDEVGAALAVLSGPDTRRKGQS